MPVKRARPGRSPVDKSGEKGGRGDARATDGAALGHASGSRRAQVLKEGRSSLVWEQRRRIPPGVSRRCEESGPEESGPEGRKTDEGGPTRKSAQLLAGGKKRAGNK